MIPANITREHILEAAREIDREGTPKMRGSYSFDLLIEERKYPPKYTVCLANKFANGEVLSASELDGGRQTNRFLGRKGFKVVKK